MANQHRYICLCNPRSATPGYVRFKLPTFNVLDEPIIHGRLHYALRFRVENETFEINLFVEIVVKLGQFGVFWNTYGIKL